MFLKNINKFFTFKSYFSDNTHLKIIFLISIFAHILNAIYSVGFYHPDEHWQILEFANHKLDLSKPSDITWEFHKQIRPGMQPFIVYLFTKISNFLGLENRMHIIMLMRLISGMLGLSVLWLLLKHYVQKIEDKNIAITLIAFSITFWFIPFCNVRVSSENWSAIAFWYGFYIAIKKPNKISSMFWAGILFAIAFQFRYQSGFLILGFYSWIWIIQNKFKLSQSLFISFFSLTAMILLATLSFDYWLYGEFVFAPYNYVYYNIVLDIASQFGGTSSFFISYLLKSAESFLLPFGIITLLLIMVSFFYLYKHPLVWSMVPFILIHFILPHKEFRFMFPLVIGIPALISEILFLFNKRYSLQMKKILNHKFTTVSIKIYFTLNLFILFNRSLFPAYEVTKSLDHIYQKTYDQKKTMHIISYPNTLLLHYFQSLTISFYNIGTGNNTVLYETAPKTKEDLLQNIQNIKQNQAKEFFLVTAYKYTEWDIQSLSKKESINIPPLFLEYDLVKSCSFEYNKLQEWYIKYNIYRMIRGSSRIINIFRCNTDKIDILY